MTPTTRRAAALSLALAAAWSAHAQPGTSAPSAVSAPASAASAPAPAASAPESAASAPESATAVSTAPTAPTTEAPTLDVTVGLAGLLSYQGGCVPVRVDVAGGTRSFDGVLRLRSDQQQDTVYEIPVSAERGARRRLHEVICPSPSMQWSWSLDGATWQAARVTPSSGPPLAAVVGEDLGRLLHLEDVLGGTGSGDVRTAVLGPDSVPLQGAAWSAAPVVVLDARVAASLPAEALTGLRDHVVAGGTLVVAGNEATSLRPDLVAAWSQGTAITTLTAADGTTFEVPSLRFGEAEGWLATRPLGAGKLVMLGLDLRDAAVRDALTPDEWRRILGVSAGGMVAMTVGDPAWLPQVESALERDRAARAPSSPVPPIVASIYLVAAGAALGVGSWVLGRKSKGIPRRRDVVLLVAGLAVPGFVVGLFRARAVVVPTTVIEYWPGLGRSRVVSWTPVERRGGIPLPGGVHSASASGAFARAFPSATFRLGAKPEVDVRDVPRFASLLVRTIDWQDMTSAPLMAARAANPPTIELLVGTGPQNAGPAMAPEGALLADLATAAVAAGAGKGVVLLEKRGDGDPRVAWIVHEVAP